MSKLAENIISLVGGKESIDSVTHCMTRLRFVLTDDMEAETNKEQLESLEGVAGVVNNGGQFQVIIGNNVETVYQEIEAQLGKEKEEGSKEDKRNWLDRFFDTLSGIFVPVIPAIAGAGILKGLLVVLVNLGWVSGESNTYMVLDVISDAVFYFLPILLAFNAAKKFRCNPIIAATIGTILLHPTFTGVVAEGNVAIDFFSIPFTLMNYSSSVLPIIIGVWLLSYIERFIKSWMPKVLDIVFTPVFSLLITVPIILIVIGPISIWIGDLVSTGINALYSNLTFIAGMVLGAVYPLLVLTGTHYGLLPIMLQNISSNGYDVILALCAAGNTAVAGTVLSVYFKAKSKTNKSLSISSTISGLIGVVEPGLYGLIIKYKKLFGAVFAGGAAGGLIMGIFQVESTGFGLNPLGGLPVFFGDTFSYYLIGITVSFIVSLVVGLIIGLPEEENK
ncbi:PTS transporter subunit EIIC [Amphibacillus sp. Q70]|uniref:PTS transporter subunit EIIC n=1 Tax=Amphibacillus sp. Q70 TaxID=3453416 RepID=UPI003F85C4DC